MPRLLLVRHGDTRLNHPKRFWGSTDVELSEIGIKQATRLAERLASEKINTIYSSKLKRCLVTAQMIASRHKAGITLCDDLREINFGYAEGLTFAEISRLHPELAESLLDWKAHPEFPGGESFDDLNRRVLQFLGGLEKHKQEENILIVAHNGVLRLIICNLLEIPVEHWLQMRIDLASLSIMETYPRGAILNSLNDTTYLETKKLQEDNSDGINR
ncbi:MAG: alpha-ribazole phosphatase [Dehalococcoidales bacterium]|nr:alpha-ribazole phosphatase [Dehalococcoidales bacterium]